MKMIKISSNELENSIYKAAESHFFAEGFCVSSMKTIGYLEAIGLPVIETFLQFLKNYNRAYPKLKIVETTDNNLEINFQNTSCIYYAESIANFILENIKQKKNIFLKNTSDCIFLLPHLLEQPINSSIYFRFQNQKYSVTAIISPQEDHPELVYQKPEPDAKNSVSLWSEEKTTAKEITHRLTARELLKNFQTNLNDGIPISEELWQSLSKQAKKVLLKSTEYSREGAGESTEFVDPEDITTT